MSPSPRAKPAGSDFYTYLLDNAPDIVVGLGGRSRILVFNKSAERLTGRSAKEVLGKRWIDVFVPKRLRKRIYSAWGDAVQAATAGGWLVAGRGRSYA